MGLQESDFKEDFDGETLGLVDDDLLSDLEGDLLVQCVNDELEIANV